MNEMGRLPALFPEKNACESPHVVILGAGASRAAFPDGDRHGLVLPLMDDLAETLGIGRLVEPFRRKDSDGFEEIYARIHSSADDSGLCQSIEKVTATYFSALELPDQVTLYDRLLLALRGKDVIATFNWDPLLADVYRRNRSVGNLPRLLFLHGNVAVGMCREHRQKGFVHDHRCGICGNALETARLLYPVTEKDYTADLFIKNEWDELTEILERAYMLTIFGYRAPLTDVAARELMLGVWMRNRTRMLAQVEIIDVEERSVLEKRWNDFFVGNHYGIAASAHSSWMFQYPRRSCDALAMATLQNDPLRDNRMPQIDDLQHLRAWIQPLVDNEVAYYQDGEPLQTA